MTLVVPVDLDARRLHRVEADALVTGFFTPEGPLRGPAAWADWRLCGLLTDRLRETHLPVEAGGATLAPTRRRLRAPWLLAVALGARAGFGAPVLREAVAAAVERALALGVARLALAFPGEALSGVAAERAAEAGLAGAAEALRRRPRPLQLRWVVPPEEDPSRARAGLGRAVATWTDASLGFRLGASDPARSPGTPAPAPAMRPPEMSPGFSSHRF